MNNGCFDANYEAADEAWRAKMWADLKRRHADEDATILRRAPSRLADFHALDPSAQRAILEIEVGL